MREKDGVQFYNSDLTTVASHERLISEITITGLKTLSLNGLENAVELFILISLLLMM